MAPKSKLDSGGARVVTRKRTRAKEKSVGLGTQ